MLYTAGMDEILIEDKKYVSSKRAAKITGYAKDYIGQLCREGRVPARLIGRSWYVLETAIQDHRFGSTEKQTISSTLEAPRYQAVTEDMTSINRSHLEDADVPNEEFVKNGTPKDLQDSWRAWFDKVANLEPAASEEPVKITRIEEETVAEQGAVSIPVHTLYEPPQEALLPRTFEPEEPLINENNQQVVEVEQAGEKKTVARNNSSIYKVVRAFAILSALIALTLGVIGTGTLDNYIDSIEQATVITGITVYNK